MPIIDFTNPITILLAVILTVLVIILGKETKRSAFIATMLFVFLAILIGHSIEFFTFSGNEAIYRALTTSLFVNFVFVFLSFISYLWIDDVQSKLGKRKSIDNSLDWFWSKV